MRSAFSDQRHNDSAYYLYIPGLHLVSPLVPHMSYMHNFLAYQSDVGDAICYAETVHADQTRSSVQWSSAPLTRTRNFVGVHG